MTNLSNKCIAQRVLHIIKVRANHTIKGEIFGGEKKYNLEHLLCL